jgi:hypothetical protein
VWELAGTTKMEKEESTPTQSCGRSYDIEPWNALAARKLANPKREVNPRVGFLCRSLPSGTGAVAQKRDIHWTNMRPSCMPSAEHLSLSSKQLSLPQSQQSRSAIMMRHILQHAQRSTPGLYTDDCNNLYLSQYEFDTAENLRCGGTVGRSSPHHFANV